MIRSWIGRLKPLAGNRMWFCISLAAVILVGAATLIAQELVPPPPPLPIDLLPPPAQYPTRCVLGCYEHLTVDLRNCAAAKYGPGSLCWISAYQNYGVCLEWCASQRH